MSEPWRTGRNAQGMLLLRGGADPVAHWAAKGLVPVHIVDLPGWTGVLPAGRSMAKPPYDDTIGALTGHAVPSRLRAVIGLFAVDGKALVTVHPHGWRTMQRWFVWAPRHGVLRPRPLVPARPQDLVRCAGVRDREEQRHAQRAVRDIMLDGSSDAMSVLADLMEVLSLPGLSLLDGSSAPSEADFYRLVEPRERDVQRFDHTAAQERRQRSELEGR